MVYSPEDLRIKAYLAEKYENPSPMPRPNTDRHVKGKDKSIDFQTLLVGILLAAEVCDDGY